MENAGSGHLPAWRSAALEGEDARVQTAWRGILSTLAEIMPVDPTVAEFIRRSIAELLDPPPGAAELEAFVTILRNADAVSAPVADPPRGTSDTARRGNDVYRAHLRSRTRDVDALRETLSRETEQAIHRNRQASSLLDSLLSRLELASELPEVMRPNERMIEELRRIAATHELVAAHFETAQASLRSVESDNARLKQELERVRTLSLTDEGTDLPNRRAFDRQLTAEIARVGREPAAFSVALLDLDHFKAVNDRHGHAAGDEILREYARDVLSSFRQHDMVARYGGEEFAVLLPETDLEGAERALAKVCARARGLAIEWEGVRIGLPTVSAGVAEHEPGEGAERLIKRADRALYRAKHKGRDRVELAASVKGAVGPSGKNLRHRENTR